MQLLLDVFTLDWRGADWLTLLCLMPPKGFKWEDLLPAVHLARFLEIRHYCTFLLLSMSKTTRQKGA